MKLRDLLDKFHMVEDDKIIIRSEVTVGSCKINTCNYSIFTLGDIIPNDTLDKEVVNFFLGSELDSCILFITVEETL